MRPTLPLLHPDDAELTAGCMSHHEAAAMCSITPSYLRKIVRRGDIRAVGIVWHGRKSTLYVDVADVERFHAQQAKKLKRTEVPPSKWIGELTWTQFDALDLLTSCGPQTAGEMAKRITSGVSAENMTRRLHAWRKKGIVQFVDTGDNIVPRDSQVRRYDATSTGRRLFAEALAIIDTMVDEDGQEEA